MKRCKTCTFYFPGSDSRPCRNKNFYYGYYYQDLPDDAIQIEFDEGADAWGLSIGPDFGCIHHEEK